MKEQRKFGVCTVIEPLQCMWNSDFDVDNTYIWDPSKWAKLQNFHRWESGNTKNLFSFSITLTQFFESWVMEIENRNQTKQLQLVWVSRKVGMSYENWVMSDENKANQTRPDAFTMAFFMREFLSACRTKILYFHTSAQAD